MNPVPFVLAIDDGSPINTYFFHDLGHRHEFFVPDAFARRFLQSVRQFGLRGKLSVIPMPLGLGRLDKSVLHLPAAAQRAFLASARELAKDFSITPELLTHYSTYNPADDRLLHVFEDEWIDCQPAEVIADYLAIALEILDNVGLTPSGVSAPWCAGVANETAFLRGIGMAFVKKLHQKRCFCRMNNLDGIATPILKVDDAQCGKVMRVPLHVNEPFWETQYPFTKQQAVRNAKREVDKLLSRDGKSGSLIPMLETGSPVVILTHWQSLFSEGRLTGLEALEELSARLQKHFAGRFAWTTMEDLAWKNGF